MKVCAKCATPEEIFKIVLSGGTGLTTGKCDICKKDNVTIFERR